MTNYNDGKWHGWNGGECPVHPESVVKVQVRSESRHEADRDKTQRRAVEWDWSIEGVDGDITAFRVTKEHKEPREFWLCGWTICTKREAAERVRDEKHDGLMEIVHVKEVLK